MKQLMTDHPNVQHFLMRLTKTLTDSCMILIGNKVEINTKSRLQLKRILLMQAQESDFDTTEFKKQT